MSAVETHTFRGFPVRAVLIDGEPWFVTTDVASVLGYRDAFNLTRRLDEDDKGTHPVSTPGGTQVVGIINEPGLFDAVLGSQVPTAREFKRWVTHDVLPSIRRTGAYAIETPEQLVARALIQAQTIVARRDEQIAVLTPRAEAWDELAAADGDYSVGDAAKILMRAGVETGPQRLFEKLSEMRWIYRGGDRAWRAYAAAVSDGYLAERAQPPRRNSADELVPVPPQVRVTVRGLERLRVRLGALNLAAVAS